MSIEIEVKTIYPIVNAKKVRINCLIELEPGKKCVISLSNDLLINVDMDSDSMDFQIINMEYK